MGRFEAAVVRVDLHPWVGLVLLHGKEEAGLVEGVHDRVLWRAWLLEVVLPDCAVQVLLRVDLGEGAEQDLL